METLKKILVIAGILAFIVLGWICGTFWPVKSLKSPESGQIQRDTVVFRDTVRIETPVEVVRWRDKTDTMLVAVTDTLRLRDTTFVVLPREIVQYADSSYRAQVSGVSPRLDWIEVFPETKIITERVTLPPKRFSFGVQVGIGAQYGLIRRQMDIGPYVGVGLQYNF